MENNVFETLNGINVNGRTEERNGFTYLSWAWAWQEVKKVYPDATYNVHKFGENCLPYVYDPNTGYMVFTDVTINGLTHEMFMAVMDSSNKAMKSEPYTYEVDEYAWSDKYKKKIKTGNKIEKTVNAATMFDINKAIMRCLVKNLAMFGLGLYIYAGEDLPEREEQEKESNTAQIKEYIRNLAMLRKQNNMAILKEIEKSFGTFEHWNHEKTKEVLEYLKKEINNSESTN